MVSACFDDIFNMPEFEYGTRVEVAGIEAAPSPRLQQHFSQRRLRG
jgi:hypothetical protein